MPCGLLRHAALTETLMGAVSQVLDLRKAMGRGRKLLLTAPADTPVFRIVLLPACRGVVAHANRDRTIQVECFRVINQIAAFIVISAVRRQK